MNDRAQPNLFQCARESREDGLLKRAHYTNFCTFRRKKNNMEMIFWHLMPDCEEKISFLHNNDLETDANQTNEQLTAPANCV